VFLLNSCSEYGFDTVQGVHRFGFQHLETGSDHAQTNSLVRYSYCRSCAFDNGGRRGYKQISNSLSRNILSPQSS